MLDNDQIARFLIQAAILLIGYFVPRWLGRSDKLTDAIDRKIDRQMQPPNGNGAAALALATLGQAHQTEIARLTKAFEDFTQETLRWRQQLTEENDRWRREEFGAFRLDVTGRLETLERGKEPTP